VKKGDNKTWGGAEVEEEKGEKSRKAKRAGQIGYQAKRHDGDSMDPTFIYMQCEVGLAMKEEKRRVTPRRWPRS